MTASLRMTGGHEAFEIACRRRAGRHADLGASSEVRNCARPSERSVIHRLRCG